MSQFLPDELESLLKQNGISFKKKSRSFILKCPRCESKDKLWILKKNGAFVCWKCKETDNFKGWAHDVLSEILGRHPAEIRAIIYEGGLPPGNDLDLELDAGLFYGEESPDEGIPAIDEIDWPWDSVDLDSPHAQKGIQYLMSRGIPETVQKRYDIRYWPSARRVLFPVKHDGHLVGYQGRALYAEQKPKILTSTGLRREYVLMFEENLTREHAVLCEGPVDAIKADLCGGNVATMGKAVSKPQLEILRKRGVKRIYLALDPDAAEEVQRLAFELGDLETYLLFPPKGRKDLGECEFEEVWEQFTRAEPFVAGNLLFDLKLPTD